MTAKTPLEDLQNALPQQGVVVWIGLSSGHRSLIQAVEEAEVLVGTGLVGDHHSQRRKGGKRQVTLIQAEHLAAVGELLHRDALRPEEVRRNIVVRGINLLALKGRQFQLGEILLECTGPCEPCSRLEENLGPGGWNAMRGHGGITARVLEGGTVRVGDPVKALPIGGKAVANCE